VTTHCLKIALACVLTIAAALGAPSGNVQAQNHDTFPDRPIRILLGFSPGGSTDTVARLYAIKLADVLKTPVVVENRAGGSQLIAIRALLASEPDGYTLFMGTGSSISQGPGVRTDLPYDTLRDFTAIAQVGTSPGVITASHHLPMQTMQDLIAYARQHPDALNYGSSGLGSASHLQMEYLLNVAGIQMTHIPYKSAAEIMNAMASDSVQIGMSPPEAALPVIQSGRVRALAVTGSRRLDALPDVPALSEVSTVAGLADVDPYTYYTLMGPKGMASAVVQKINAAVNAVSRMPEVIAYMRERTFEPSVGSPEDLYTFIAQDLEKWRRFSQQITLD